MIATLLYLLVLLQLKHWYVDFVNQTMEEVNSKGIYLDWQGMKHSIKHGIGTTMCIWIIVGWESVEWAVFFGVLDYLAHYHIDWLKMNINKWRNLSVDKNEFWLWLGADQLAHQLTYIAIAGLTIL